MSIKKRNSHDSPYKPSMKLALFWCCKVQSSIKMPCNQLCFCPATIFFGTLCKQAYVLSFWGFYAELVNFKFHFNGALIVKEYVYTVLSTGLAKTVWQVFQDGWDFIAKHPPRRDTEPKIYRQNTTFSENFVLNVLQLSNKEIWYAWCSSEWLTRQNLGLWNKWIDLSFQYNVLQFSNYCHRNPARMLKAVSVTDFEYKFSSFSTDGWKVYAAILGLLVYCFDSILYTTSKLRSASSVYSVSYPGSKYTNKSAYLLNLSSFDALSQAWTPAPDATFCKITQSVNSRKFVWRYLNQNTLTNPSRLELCGDFEWALDTSFFLLFLSFEYSENCNKNCWTFECENLIVHLPYCRLPLDSDLMVMISWVCSVSGT